jgi:hypothetical protein
MEGLGMKPRICKALTQVNFGRIVPCYQQMFKAVVNYKEKGRTRVKEWWCVCGNKQPRGEEK